MKSFAKLLFLLVLSVQSVPAAASWERLVELPSESEQQEVTLASEKNDLADEILAQSSLPADFPAQFLAMLDDSAQGTIWHNYILQKLDTLYLHPDAAEQREAILKRLWQESRSPSPTFAGTTLMTLQRLHEQRPDVVETSKLSKHAQWVAEREGYSNSDRLSALHVLSAVNSKSAASIARRWLGEDAAPLLLKTTAIAVLGKAPEPSDTALIEGYLDHPDLRLRTAARAVLNGGVEGVIP
jgi:hypothetical protein